MKVLITGGAGYVGSHICVDMLVKGHEILLVDNFSNSNPQVISKIKELTNCDFKSVNCDLRDEKEFGVIFSEFLPEAIVHLAGFKAVQESVEDPVKYYRNNLESSLILMHLMDEFSCNKIVFSSSATVYGRPKYLPLDENHPLCPINPYGHSKKFGEQILLDWCSVSKKRTAIALRYFNPVGAHESGLIGERPVGSPNNLMPFVTQVALGLQDCLYIYGNDYDTDDGTGERDFIHVMDIAEAHGVALNLQKPGFSAINIGRGKPYSVLKIVKLFEQENGLKIPFKIKQRRLGDISSSWTNISKAENLLNWSAKRDLKQMCKDRWHWELQNSLETRKKI